MFPVRQGNVTANNYAGGNITFCRVTVYDFYDNSGISGQYNLNQSNQLKLTPSGASFTTGDRVRVRFLDCTSNTTVDRIHIWNNNDALLD